MITLLKPRQQQILYQLGVFKFLTYKQMIKLGIGDSVPAISKQMQYLLQRKYVTKISKASDGSQNSLPDIFHLTKKGAKLVSEFREEIFNVQYPKTPYDEIPGTMKHTLEIINFHIDISRFSVTFCETEYNHIGSQKEGNLTKKTLIRYGEGKKIIPDMIFAIKSDDITELFLVEVERTYRNRKSKENISIKFKQHIELIRSGVVPKLYKYNSEYDHKVLIILENMSYFKTLIEDTKELVKPLGFEEAFLFKSFDDDSYEGWVNFNGEERFLFLKD